jgi:hypothetical protein
VKKCILSDKNPECAKCGGNVKPDIVFFGEMLPDRFWTSQVFLGLNCPITYIYKIFAYQSVGQFINYLGSLPFLALWAYYFILGLKKKTTVNLKRLDFN